MLKKTGVFFTVLLLIITIACSRAHAYTSVTDSLEHMLTGELADTSRINILIELAVVYRNQNPVTAFSYLNHAIEVAERSGNTNLQGKINFTRGNLYLNRADYKNAQFYFVKALRFYEAQKNYENASRCLNNIGVVYSYMKKIELAEKYFMESMQMREKHGYTRGNGVLYASIGYVKSERGDYNGAVHYYHKSIVAARAENDSAQLSSAYTNMGNIHNKHGKYVLAEKYLKQALAIGKAMNDNYYISISYLYLGQGAVEKKDYKLAETYTLLGKKYAEEGEIRPQHIESLKALTEIYALQRKYKDAYETRLLYEKLNDSTLNENTYKQVNELQASYDLEKKNNEIILLSKDKQIAMANTEREELLRNILIIVCVFILALVVVLVRNVRLKQRLNRSLKKENKVLAEENILTKYELLKSKVEPHFLFNSLNTLSSIVSIDKDKAIEFIAHFSTLYRSILESGDLPLLPLSQEVEIMESYLYLQKVRFGDKLDVEISLPQAHDYTLPPFALQMMIENAVKHNVISHAKKLRIRIYREDNKLIVENNLQKKNRTEESTGTGQKNILERYKILEAGTPVFEETAVVYRVTLPLIGIKQQEPVA
jgi:tetratricopeptide (TPR) repeat protein